MNFYQTFQVFRLDGGNSEQNLKLPLARLRNSKEISFFPNNFTGSVWDYNDFDALSLLHPGDRRPPSPAYVPRRWKRLGKIDQK